MTKERMIQLSKEKDRLINDAIGSIENANLIMEEIFRSVLGEEYLLEDLEEEEL